MKYPAVFKKSGNSYTVTFRDVPQAITQGFNYKEAASMALDALTTAFDFYKETNTEIPLPSKAREGEVLIELPLGIATKVLLLNAVTSQRISQAKLARLMNVKPQYVTRIFDIKHSTKIDTIEKAFNAIGLSLELTVTDVKYA